MVNNRTLILIFILFSGYFHQSTSERSPLTIQITLNRAPNDDINGPVSLFTTEEADDYYYDEDPKVIEPYRYSPIALLKRSPRHLGGTAPTSKDPFYDGGAKNLHLMHCPKGYFLNQERMCQKSV